MRTWQTQTETEPCAQTQNKQRNIEQGQYIQDSQGRILTHIYIYIYIYIYILSSKPQTETTSFGVNHNAVNFDLNKKNI